jgi:hypothetical protein
MPWEWSHTEEAIQNVRDNLELLSRETLLEICVEWKVHLEAGNDATEADFQKHEKDFDHVSTDGLIYYIWDNMKSQALCEPGGHTAWSCPWGCICHLVPFSSEDHVKREA